MDEPIGNDNIKVGGGHYNKFWGGHFLVITSNFITTFTQLYWDK